MAEKSTIDQILEHNARFVEEREYDQFKTNKYPDKKLAVVSCMDTRLTALLMAALGLKNGDAKIIKVAGAEVSHPFGSVMRSLLIAVCELGVEDIMIVAHTNCGAQHMSGEGMVSDMLRLGVSADHIKMAHHCGIDFDQWLAGFGDTEEAVRKSVDVVRNHPVMPPHVRVAGFIMDSETGEPYASRTSIHQEHRSLADRRRAWARRTFPLRRFGRASRSLRLMGERRRVRVPISSCAGAGVLPPSSPRNRAGQGALRTRSSLRAHRECRGPCCGKAR